MLSNQSHYFLNNFYLSNECCPSGFARDAKLWVWMEAGCLRIPKAAGRCVMMKGAR